jgi:hypothetical protein
MIVKILGILDLLAAIFFWVFGLFGIIPQSIIFAFAFYLLIKGTIFLITAERFASILDIACGVIMFLAISFSMPEIVTILVALYLVQKGIFSLL